MRDAVDFMSAPDPGLLKSLDLDALPYTGSARPSADWFAQMSAVGLPVRCMIQETVSTRSQSGYQAGVLDCQFAESRAREVNPDVQSIAVVVSDGSYSDAWDASGYGQGWASVATLQFFPYGALGVTSTFLAGAKTSPLSIDGEWVPETWGTGRLMSQVVGPSPVPDSDLNHVHADYTGGSTPSPKELPEMFVGLKQTGGNVYAAAWVDGGQIIRWFGGANSPFGFLQVPKDAVDFANRQALKPEVLTAGEWAPIEKRTAASQVTPTGGSSAPSKVTSTVTSVLS